MAYKKHKALHGHLVDTEIGKFGILDRGGGKGLKKHKKLKVERNVFVNDKTLQSCSGETVMFPRL